MGTGRCGPNTADRALPLRTHGRKVREGFVEEVIPMGAGGLVHTHTHTHAHARVHRRWWQGWDLNLSLLLLNRFPIESDLLWKLRKLRPREGPWLAAVTQQRLAPEWG